jgi:tetratricopeptide (TPR) repeat protein/predicted Ser/Thr protein kinase
MGFSDAPTHVTPNPTGGARCLEIDDLVAMVEGSLSSERGEVVLGHVDRCAACAEVIANLGSLEGTERRIGRYQIEKLLGTGGMGIVYAAFDPELQRKVAIKLVRPDTTNDALQALMIKEARTLARLSHPNIVAVFDVGKHDDEVYFATELVDGTTLADWQKHRTRDEIVGAWIQVARGLAAAHAAGVVHRDVKPANVLVGRDGRARIGDFGIAYRETAGDSLEPLSPHAERSWMRLVAGTPAYMAPEQKSGMVDARSDQFSTAIALAKALTSAAIATGVVLIALGGADDTCQIVEVPAHVWSPARRAAVAKVTTTDLAPTIENYVARWSGASRDVCRSKDAAVRRARTRCLERQLARLDALLASWDSTPPRGPFQAHLAFDGFPHPAWCSEQNVAVVGDPSAEQLAEIEAVEKLLDAVRGNSSSEIEDVEKIRIRARATGNAPLVRHASRMLASMRRGELPAKISTLRAAIAEPPDDFSKVYVMNDLVGTLGADQIAEAERIAAEAHALTARLGGDPILDAETDWNLGVALRTGARTTDAITALERARHTMAGVLGPDSPQVGNILIVLGSAYYARDGITSTAARDVSMAADAIWKQHLIPLPSTLIATSDEELVKQATDANMLALEVYGQKSEAAFHGAFALMEVYDVIEQPAKAIAEARRALALGAELGIKTSRVPFIRGQLARMLLDDGKTAEAITLAEQAIALAASMSLEEELATARAVLGRALLTAGRKAEARKPLEDALAYYVRTNGPPQARGRTRFVLAQVTGEVDEARVARSELVAYKSTPDADVTKNPVGAPHMLRYIDAWIAKVDAWLAAHK